MKTRAHIVSFASLLVAGAALLGCIPGCSKGTSDTGPKTRPPPLVVVGKVQARDVPVEATAPVELRPFAQADVGSKTLGYLDAVLVDRGDVVKRGQLLALVRPSDLPDQLAAARGTLAQTQATVALARTNFERAQKLAPSGVVSQQELQSSAGALAQAEAQEQAAQSSAGALAVRLGETRIESPLDGVVAVRKLDPGALVGLMSGTTILTVTRIDTLRVFVAVSERDIKGVRVGQDAHVELDALPDKTFTGKVIRIAPSLDPTTRTLDAEVQLPNASGELHPGMFGRGSIVLDVHPHAPIVPATALQITDGKPFVFVLQGDKVHRRAIAIGVDEGALVEVKSGVTEGEEIVTAGIDVVSDGATVRVARDVDPYSGAKAANTPAPAAADPHIKD